MRSLSLHPSVSATRYDEERRFLKNNSNKYGSDCWLHHPSHEENSTWSSPWYLLQAPRRGERAKGSVRSRSLGPRRLPERVRTARGRQRDQGSSQESRSKFANVLTFKISTLMNYSSIPSQSTSLRSANSKPSSVVLADSTIVLSVKLWRWIRKQIPGLVGKGSDLRQGVLRLAGYTRSM